MTKDINTDEVLKAAEESCNMWLPAFKSWSNGCIDAVSVNELLAKGRTYKGEQVFALTVRSPEEVKIALLVGATVKYLQRDEKRKPLKTPALIADALKAHIDKDVSATFIAELLVQTKLQLGDGFVSTISRMRKDSVQRAYEKYKSQLYEARNCVWDYYIAAFYESAYAHPSLDRGECAEFLSASLFSAFEQGLGYIINLGGLVIGVGLPEFYRDEQMRLHREVGPAIVWGKTKRYFWRGTEVPGEWIEDKESVDPSVGLSWENIEQRRAFTEIVGWAKILDTLKSEVIDKNPDPQIGTLLRANIPDQGMTQFLRVMCGTGREFVIAVPPTVQTAQEAQNWMWNIEDYAPEIRT